MLNSFFRLSSNHFSVFFLTRTPDHFQTIILASVVLPVPTACFATSCFHSPLLHNSHTTAVSSNTVNSPVGVASCPSMPQPTNTTFVRSQVALSNPQLFSVANENGQTPRYKAFGSHDCNVSKNAALQLSNGPGVNRGAFWFSLRAHAVMVGTSINVGFVWSWHASNSQAPEPLCIPTCHFTIVSLFSEFVPK